MPSMALILLVKVQSRVFTAKCSEPQVGISNGMDGGSGVAEEIQTFGFFPSYCVNLLRKWTDEGKDLMAYLPYMKTMLGHEGFEKTAYYLKLTVERFPYIKECLKSSFPDLIKEVTVNEQEFY